MNHINFSEYNNEDELCRELEKNYFPDFFDNNWKVIKGVTWQVCIRKDTRRSIVDYFGYKNNIPTYVEVKNDRIRQRYLIQLLRYYCDCNEENNIFNLCVICTKIIRPNREKVLHKLGIQIISIDDINKGLDSWM